MTTLIQILFILDALAVVLLAAHELRGSRSRRRQAVRP